MKTNLHLPNLPAGAIILIYHRIENVDTNPWGICISPQNFENQIRFLKKNFNVLSVDDLSTGVASGTISENSVCITFDDGYADNYMQAKPILEKYNCAATFFIATVFINQKKPYWWDDLEMIFLHSKKLPGQLSLQVSDEDVSYRLNENELSMQQCLQHKKWKWHQAPPTDRCKIFLSIWEKLASLRLEKIEIIIDYLKEWSGYTQEKHPQRLPMNVGQLRKLSENNLFTLAIHTHTHCDLSKQSKEIQLEEITLCKNFLYDQLNIRSSYFSYPFGRYNDDTIDVVNELNLAACFTTQALTVNKESNNILLGRYQPFNWDERTFSKQMADWLATAAGNLVYKV